jgi:hypothetical protein
LPTYCPTRHTPHTHRTPPDASRKHHRVGEGRKRERERKHTGLVETVLDPFRQEQDERREDDAIDELLSLASPLARGETYRMCSQKAVPSWLPA